MTKMSIRSVIIGILISALILPTMAFGQGSGTITQIQQWLVSNGFIKTASSTAKLWVPGLASPGDCVVTDASGKFSTATCGSGGGGGGGTTTPTLVYSGGTLDRQNTTTNQILLGALSTSSRSRLEVNGGVTIHNTATATEFVATGTSPSRFFTGAVFGGTATNTDTQTQTYGTSTASLFNAASSTATSTFYGLRLNGGTFAASSLAVASCDVKADATTGHLYCGTDVSGGAGSQTPWTSNIDADGFGLANALYVNIMGSTTASEATFGSATVGTITATSTTGTSTFPNASTTNLAISGIAPSSLLKLNTNGLVDNAVAGTDYQSPLTAGTDYVQPSRSISTTYPLQGGGDLSANRTLTIAFGTTTANTWASIQTFTSGIVAQATSTFTGLAASTTYTTGLIVVGTSTQAGISASYLSLNGNLSGLNATFNGVTTTNPVVSQTGTSSFANLTVGFATTTQLSISRGFFQDGLGDCTGAANKIVYTLTSGKFGCAADQTGGGSGTATDTPWQIIPAGVRLTTTTNQVLIGASATQTTSSLEVQGTSTLSRLLVGGYGTTQQAGIVDASAYITGSSSGRNGVIMQNYGTGNAPEYRFLIGDPYASSEYIAFGLTNSGATNGGALNGLQKNDILYIVGNSGRDMLITNGNTGSENLYITAQTSKNKPVLKIDGATQRLGIGYATTTIGGSLLSVNGDAEVANFTATGTVTSSQSIFGSSTIGILNATSTTASSTMQGVDLNALRIRSLGAGLAKLNSSGYVGVATAGTDYENPLTFTSPIQRSSNTVFLNTGSLTIGALSATTSFTANTASIGTSSIGTLNATSSLNVMGTTTGNGASFTYLTLNGGNLTAGAISGTSITTTASSSISNLTIGTFASTTQLSVSRGFFQDGLPDCSTAGTSKLLYTLSSGKFSCGTDQTGGGSSRPSTYSYIVDTAGLGDFTTIQGALDACAAAGGGSIYLSNHYYYLGATGLKFKSNDCSVFGIYASTTIEIAGATTAFSTNSAASAYANNTISNVVIVGDGTAGSIGIDLSDLVRSRFTGIVMDNLDIGFRVNDTQNVTHYSTVRDFVLTTMGSYGIYASSTNPANDIKWTDGFIGCTADCTGIHLNNTQAHIFSGISIEPGSTTGTIGVRIDVSGSAANNGTFSNQFMGIYIEGNKIGVSASSSIGTKIVLGNAFHGGQIVANTHDLLLSSSSSIETFGTIVNYETKTMLSTTSIASFLQDGFTDCTGAANKVVYTLATGKFGCATDQTGGGGGGGSGPFATNTINTLTYLSTQWSLMVGGAATTTDSRLEVNGTTTASVLVATSSGNTVFDLQNIGIGSSTPYANISIRGSSTPWYEKPFLAINSPNYPSLSNLFITATTADNFIDIEVTDIIAGIGKAFGKFGERLYHNINLAGKVNIQHPYIDCAIPTLLIQTTLAVMTDDEVISGCPQLFFDENTDANVNFIPMNYATSGLTTFVVQAGSTAGQGAADGAAIRTNYVPISSSSSPSMDVYFSVAASAATSTAGRIFMVGFTQETIGGTYTRIPANFVGLVASGTDSNYWFVTSDGGSQTIKNTGVASTSNNNPAVQTPNKISIGMSPNEAWAMINGVMVARATTTVPTDTLHAAVIGSASPNGATTGSAANAPVFLFGGMRIYPNREW